MKGAIGNAFILNMVITFIVIFYMLLISSMAYSKAYKVKNYLINSVVSYDEKLRSEGKKLSGFNDFIREFKKNDWDLTVNDTLSKYGYILALDKHCPVNEFDRYPKNTKYVNIRNTKAGSYDYCIYLNYIIGDDAMIFAEYNYMVLVYMKFDFPVVGNFLKLPLTGETKTITVFK